MISIGIIMQGEHSTQVNGQLCGLNISRLVLIVSCVFLQELPGFLFSLLR